MDTPIPKIIANCFCRGWPFSNSRLICSCYSCLLIARGASQSLALWRQPVRQGVRSTINSLQSIISASADVKKESLIRAALVHPILSVKNGSELHVHAFLIFNTAFLLLRPSLSNFQTTKVSPLFTYANAVQAGAVCNLATDTVFKMRSGTSKRITLRKSIFWSIVDAQACNSMHDFSFTSDKEEFWSLFSWRIALSKPSKRKILWLSINTNSLSLLTQNNL